MAEGMQRVALPTGVELDVAVAGSPGDPPVILLHGFPESHRTWRGVIPELARDHFVLAPDQRGYARSSKPEGVGAYAVDYLVADLLALADHYGIDRFTLVGHDWGGAVAWAAALRHPDRVARLAIVNAPHPWLFQRALFDDPAQRRASQYVTAFRGNGFVRWLAESGLERFFASTFAHHVVGVVAGADKAAYLDEWAQPGAMTAMLNWYRASPVIVPAMDDTPPRPAWIDVPFPPVTQDTLVIWGTQDHALLPSLVDDLPPLVPRLMVDKIDAGHFVTWQRADAVVAAMRRWGI